MERHTRGGEGLMMMAVDDGVGGVNSLRNVHVVVLFLLIKCYLAQGLVSLHPRASLLKDLSLLSGLDDNAIGGVVEFPGNYA